MRIILHAGLHKSGTTSVQDGWNRAYGEHPDAWYPSPRHGAPGHHRVMRPLLRAFTRGLAPDLAAASVGWQERGGGRQTLDDLLGEAGSRGVGTLLFSSENLDRAHEEDRETLAAAWGDTDLTLVLTVTRPVHRWCSGWQTLVKRGLAEYPVDAQRHVVEAAALAPGRLEELTTLFPASRCVVRLVRNAPPEPDLAADLAAALGLPPGARGDAPVVHPVIHNASLGRDTEVVLRINRADLALGTDREGVALLEALRGDGFAYRESGDLAARYAVPAAVLAAAEVEAGWLRGLDDGAGPTTLLDPHDLLPTWTDPAVPQWYDAVSRAEAVVPELEGAEDRETQLWRARQERTAYRKQAQRLRRR